MTLGPPLTIACVQTPLAVDRATAAKPRDLALLHSVHLVAAPCLRHLIDLQRASAATALQNPAAVAAAAVAADTD